MQWSIIFVERFYPSRTKIGLRSCRRPVWLYCHLPHMVRHNINDQTHATLGTSSQHGWHWPRQMMTKGVFCAIGQMGGHSMLCDVTSLKEYQLHVLWVFVGTEGDCGLPATHVTKLVPPGKQKLAWTLSMLTFMKLCRQIFQRLFGAQVWIDSKEVLPRNDPHQTQKNVDQTRVFWTHDWHSTFCMTCIEIISHSVSSAK